MNFLNQALAFGAAAFVIPLLIHILNRSRFQTVEWGAMHLLESVIRVNHKRFRLEQLILLLVRCAIPILLALCLARPVVTGSRVLEGDAPVSLVVLLDNSYSMDAVTESGTRFEEAVDAANAIITTTSRGSEIAVIQSGGRPTPLFDQPVFDAEAIARRCRQLRGGFGASNMQAALDEALTTLAGMSHARRELVVISDFQQADWQRLEGDIADSIESQIATMDIEPALTLLQVGKPVSGNVSVESLEFPRRALGVGQQLGVRANLRNHGRTEYSNARVLLRIDGTEDSVTQITLAANGDSQVFFPCSFDKPGSHVIEVEIVADDSLTTDNRFAAAVTVWDNVKVVLVDGDPSAQPLQSETDYLSVALTPFTFGRVSLSDLVETNTIATKEITDDLLKSARVVVLANVSKLDDAKLGVISDYVNGGGALLVCPGNRIDLNWYREKLYASGVGLLAAPYGSLQGSADDKDQTAHLVSQRFEHPALEFFNEAANGDLSTATFRQWYTLGNDVGRVSPPVQEQLKTDEDTRPTSDEIVMARLDSGDPLLIEHRVGDGVVVQMATACDADWSDLPLRPVFVPLMQQLISTMASRISPPRNITTGEPAAALFDKADADTATIVTPDGSRRTLKLTSQGKRQLASFEHTQRPGVYAMTGPSSETLHFVAETSRDESRLEMLDEQQLASLAEALPAGVIKSHSDYLKQDHLRRNGREIWRYLLGGLLAFMFVELVLQQRFARVRA